MGYNLNACNYLKQREKEYRINMIKDTCLFPIATQSFVLQDPEDCRRSQRLNNSDWKQSTQAINKIEHKIVHKY
jgi:hypothetical protein